MGADVSEPFTHFRGEIGKDEIDGKHAEIGFLEVWFSCVEKYQSLLVVPPCGTHELDREILKMDGNSPPARVFKNITDFVFTGFSAPQGGLADGESIGPRQSYDLDVVTKQFVLEFQAP